LASLGSIRSSGVKIDFRVKSRYADRIFFDILHEVLDAPPSGV
jgi:hypothetical protein